MGNLQITTKNVEPKMLSIIDVKCGDIFLYSGSFYMKIYDGTGIPKAVILKSGVLVTFETDKYYPIFLTEDAQLIVSVLNRTSNG